MGYIATLFFFKDGFGIKWPKKVDMPAKKESKPNKIPNKNIEKKNLPSNGFCWTGGPQSNDENSKVVSI